RDRVAALRRDRSPRARDVRAMMQRWAKVAATPNFTSPLEGVFDPRSGSGGGSGRTENTPEVSVGALIALAFPERIAKNRGAGGGAFLLANGRRGALDPASPLAREPFLAVAELAGSAAQSRILSAAPITLGEIESRFADRITAREEVAFDAASLSLRGRNSRRLGAIVLGERAVPVLPAENNARLLAESIANLGIDRLPWTDALKQWRDRVMFLRHSEGADWPDLSDAALAARAAEWLAPALAGKTALAKASADDFAAAVRELLPWPFRRRAAAEGAVLFAIPARTPRPHALRP